MDNVMDYLDWRGDIGFDVSDFNEVDNLIFSLISYLDFSFIKDRMTIEDASRKYFETRDINQLYKNKPVSELTVDFEKLLKKLAEKERFKNVFIAEYISIFEMDKEIQFSAISFFIDEKLLYVAFRGTDETLVGFKEDFNMSFSKSVPAQEYAAKYLDRILKKYDYGRIIVGGHSKGGNLAVYSVVKLDREEKDRIEIIYNNDGPGFIEQMYNSDAYKETASKVQKILPESSLVGMLMDDHEKKKVIKAKGANGYVQHNGLNWYVRGTSFVEVENFTEQSMFIGDTLKHWLYSMTDSEREEFVDEMYGMITSTKRLYVEDISNNRIKFFFDMLKSVNSLQGEKKDVVQKNVRGLLKSGTVVKKQQKRLKKRRFL